MNTKTVMTAILGLGLVTLLIVVIAMATQPVQRDLASCPADYQEQTPVIIISMDGFRANYRERELTPMLERLATEGVSVPYMYPSYPTVTFPNHYTIVTGLYPESHGIIANSFYDPEFFESFSLSNDGSKEGKWWGGEPIWNTLTRQGKKSATYFWPGSDADIGGMYPTYWFPYNTSVPFEDRVVQVLDWVQLPAEERPAWITLYFNEPDHTGHDSGPDSDELNDQLVRMDGLLASLVEGLETANLLDCVNIIVVADHGMASGGPSWVIKLSDYIPDVYDAAYTYTGAFTRIDPKDESEEVKQGMMKNLSCQRTDLRQYEKAGLPTRFHFSNNARIEDIVLDMDAGRSGSVSSDWYNMGNHGYDNYAVAMHALFVARGPAFHNNNTVVAPFQNIELYNLMCHLTGVEPSPNNGTMGSLNSLLVNPITVEELSPEPLPPTALYPDEANLPNRLPVSKCPGDLTAAESWLDALNQSEDDQNTALARHLPWGVPQTDKLSANVTLLFQEDHVTGYSSLLKMPLWTSFSLDPSTMFGTAEAEWSSDVRLDASNSVTCNDYSAVFAADNVTVMAPLFAPVFSSNSTLDRVPYMVSNAVPSTTQQQGRWKELKNQMLSWLGAGQLNIVTGPVFDNIADSIVDNFTEFTSVPTVPSDWFAIVTRCGSGGDITQCDHADLDTRTFIYPTILKVENCLESERYALEFSSTVGDAVTVTGITFFPTLSFAHRAAIETTVHSYLW